VLKNEPRWLQPSKHFQAGEQAMFHYSRRNTLQLVRYCILSVLFLWLASASVLAQVTSGTIFGRVSYRERALLFHHTGTRLENINATSGPLFGKLLSAPAWQSVILTMMAQSTC
jgi:hypothetical protein